MENNNMDIVFKVFKDVFNQCGFYISIFTLGGLIVLFVISEFIKNKKNTE